MQINTQLLKIQAQIASQYSTVVLRPGKFVSKIYKVFLAWLTSSNANIFPEFSTIHSLKTENLVFKDPVFFHFIQFIFLWVVLFTHTLQLMLVPQFEDIIVTLSLSSTHCRNRILCSCSCFWHSWNLCSSGLLLQTYKHRITIWWNYWFSAIVTVAVCIYENFLEQSTAYTFIYSKNDI